MNSTNLTEEQVKTMRYPPSIIEWEIRHGIVRYEQNGMLYVRGQLPEDMIFSSIRREQKEIKEREEREKRQKRGDGL